MRAEIVQIHQKSIRLHPKDESSGSKAPGELHLYQGPVHSYAREDAQPMVPGETAVIEIRLNPISVRIERGHRVRVAIAGADAAIFRRVPADGTPTLTLERNSEHTSFVELPVVRTR